MRKLPKSSPRRFTANSRLRLFRFIRYKTSCQRLTRSAFIPSSSPCTDSGNMVISSRMMRTVLPQYGSSHCHSGDGFSQMQWLYLRFSRRSHSMPGSELE